jgi:hypothetical protein
MANNHIYGFRFKRSISGNETPQILTYPIASAYAPDTGADGAGGTACNLNIGDPVQLLADGTVRLVQPGQSALGADIDDRTFGIGAGFPRVLVGGFPRPNGFYTSGTAPAPGGDNQTLCAVIPVEGNIFEIDCDAAGGGSLDSKAEWQAVVGSTANFVYSVLTSGAGQPKANPLLDVSDISEGAEVNQLRIIGLGKGFDQQDPTLTHVTLQVIFNEAQIYPVAVGNPEADDNVLAVQPAMADLEA